MMGFPHLRFLMLTTLVFGMLMSGCSKQTDAPKQEDQAQQAFRKEKTGD